MVCFSGVFSFFDDKDDNCLLRITALGMLGLPGASLEMLNLISVVSNSWNLVDGDSTRVGVAFGSSEARNVSCCLFQVLDLELPAVVCHIAKAAVLPCILVSVEVEAAVV